MAIKNARTPGKVPRIRAWLFPYPMLFVVTVRVFAYVSDRSIFKVNRDLDKAEKPLLFS